MTASMDSSRNERKLLLHCVKELLVLETALSSGRRASSTTLRRDLVLLQDVTESLTKDIPLHPALEGLTVEDLIGYRIEETRSLIRKASSGAAVSGPGTGPEGRGSPLETT